jgi:Holliday junction resolvase RusA-like endonuclease
VLSGETFRRVSAEYGISAPRARQIFFSVCRKSGLPLSEAGNLSTLRKNKNVYLPYIEKLYSPRRMIPLQLQDYLLADSVKVVEIPFGPVGKPRMTRRDKWKKRDCVVRYREWCDAFRACIGNVPDAVVGVSWIATIPMPRSWSKKKRLERIGTLHDSRPDRDNLDKAILDSLFAEDSGIAFGFVAKFWAEEGGMTVYFH